MLHTVRFCFFLLCALFVELKASVLSFNGLSSARISMNQLMKPQCNIMLAPGMKPFSSLATLHPPANVYLCLRITARTNNNISVCRPSMQRDSQKHVPRLMSDRGNDAREEILSCHVKYLFHSKESAAKTAIGCQKPVSMCNKLLLCLPAVPQCNRSATMPEDKRLDVCSCFFV